MARPALFPLLALLACQPKTTTESDASSSSRSSSPSPDARGRSELQDAATSTTYPTAPQITLQLEKPASMEFLGRGSWAAFSQNGERAIVGAPGRATLLPGEKVLPERNPSNAAFAPNGKRFFVVQAGQNAVTNEVWVHSADDLHVVVKLENALDPRWIGDQDVAFHRDGQVFRIAAGDAAAAKLIGPSKAAFVGRPRLALLDDDAKEWIVVDQDERRVTGVRRIRLATSAETTLLPSSVAAQFTTGKGSMGEPSVAVAPDLSRACIMGHLRGGTSIWCATDAEPAAEVAFSNDASNNFGISFVSKTKLAFKRSSGGTVGIIDFTSRTISIVVIPGSTSAIDMIALPGSKLAIARDTFRIGIVDLEARKFAPIGDDSHSPSSPAGVGVDDSVLAVAGSSLANGPGVFRVRSR